MTTISEIDNNDIICESKLANTILDTDYMDTIFEINHIATTKSILRKNKGTVSFSEYNNTRSVTFDKTIDEFIGMGITNSSLDKLSVVKFETLRLLDKYDKIDTESKSIINNKESYPEDASEHPSEIIHTKETVDILAIPDTPSTTEPTLIIILKPFLILNQTKHTGSHLIGIKYFDSVIKKRIKNDHIKLKNIVRYALSFKKGFVHKKNLRTILICTNFMLHRGFLYMGVIKSDHKEFNEQDMESIRSYFNCRDGATRTWMNDDITIYQYHDSIFELGVDIIDLFCYHTGEK